MDREMEQFFSAVRSPVMVSDLITLLAAGVPVKADRVPLALLPCVILLSTVGYRSYGQQIVDDYAALLERFREEWLSRPDRTHRDLDHPLLYYVVLTVERGVAGEYNLDVLPDAGYVFKVYERLVNTELESLFPEEAVQCQSR